MKARIFLVYMLLIVSVSACKIKFVDMNVKNARLLETKKMRFCYISFVQVGDIVYLVKQKHVPRKILGVVRDAITAYVAESFNIAHEVDVIPADQQFPGKVIEELPATIHTVAPGQTIKAQDSPYSKMNIKQAEIGFRRDMLDWMVTHPQLIKVVALDTFLCNHDRHRGNLFYDPKTKTFCAIDMDSAFKYNLAALACKNFTKMAKKGLFPLTNRELRALIEYRNALEFLVDKHHPEDTIAVFNDFIKKAGFVEGSSLYTERIALELDLNRAMMKESYQDIKELIKILNGIIKKEVQSRKSHMQSRLRLLND